MLKTAIIGGLCAAATLTAAPAQAAESCGSLPAQVQGSPNVQPHQAGVAYLWHDAQGWKLRVTHPGANRVVVTGTITASRGVAHVQPVRLERDDAFAVSRDGRTLSFRMSDYGGIDGLDFRADCSPTMHLSIRVNGRIADPGQVFLGAHRVHPTSVPLTIQRS